MTRLVIIATGMERQWVNDVNGSSRRNQLKIVHERIQKMRNTWFLVSFSRHCFQNVSAQTRLQLRLCKNMVLSKHTGVFKIV
jgi:hypothetical protein